MTHSFTTRNVNSGFPATVTLLRERGVPVDTRNGLALEYPEPVSVTFTHPRERVLYDRQRNINPWLHFLEPLWVLAGRDDVAFLQNIVKRFADFSDDGKTFNAAYGHRMRFPDDQIAEAILRLRTNPLDRRVVVTIRRPDDIHYNGKDTACNLLAALSIRDGLLNMHVFNRSNDVVWGGPAGGTNFPQFTVLMEYLAGHIGCGLGTYTTTTNNMHAYLNAQWNSLKDKTVASASVFYEAGAVRPYPMMAQPRDFDADLHRFFQKPWGTGLYVSDYFNKVVDPMWKAFMAHKAGDPAAYSYAMEVAAQDWSFYVMSWLDINSASARQEKFQ